VTKNSLIKCNQTQLFKRKNDTQIFGNIRTLYVKTSISDGDKQQITCH
jgi:hypothetical protein